MSYYRVGSQFERYLVRKYRDKGFMAWRTPKSGTPVDLIIYDPKNQKWILVQVKKVRKGKLYPSRFKKEKEELTLWAKKFFEKDPKVEVWFWIWYLPERKWIKERIV